MASLLFAAEERKPLVVRVDHFYLVSEDSERLFQVFRDEFKLPVVWPFKSYGDFGSGGLSLLRQAFGGQALENKIPFAFWALLKLPNIGEPIRLRSRHGGQAGAGSRLDS
jgi:hypothetical protein